MNVQEEEQAVRHLLKVEERMTLVKCWMKERRGMQMQKEMTPLTRANSRQIRESDHMDSWDQSSHLSVIKVYFLFYSCLSFRPFAALQESKMTLVWPNASLSNLL
jgi:hypothetical protein